MNSVDHVYDGIWIILCKKPWTVKYVYNQTETIINCRLGENGS